MMRKPQQVLGMLVVLATAWAWPAHAADLAAVALDPMQVQWAPQVDYERLVLTVSRPDGAVVRRELAAGGTPVFDVVKDGAGDGFYRWELRVTPRIDPAIRKELAAARKKGEEEAVAERLRAAGKLPAGSMVQSGSFRVVDGSVVRADLRETRGGASGSGSGGSGDPGGKPAAAKAQGTVNLDQVIADDLIVQGSACVGLDCVNNESFGFDTLRLKENNTRIKFEDTSTGTGFPTHDWQLTANDSASGGAEKFSIEDITAATVPFTITGSAPSNALFVDSTGRLGLRTSTPVLDIHVATSNTPAMRLEQTSAGGFTAQTWDIAGNEANFFVRDVTGGSRLPLRIRPGAPTSSIDISAAGNVGIGTASPSAKVHVSSTGTTSTDGKVLIQNSSTTTTARELLEINNNGGAILILKDTSQTPRWSFGTTGTTFVIDNQAHTGLEMSLDQNGNATFLGTVTPGSSRTIKEGFNAIEPLEVLSKVAALPITTWSYKQDPGVRHIGPMAEDFFSAFAVGADAKGISVTDSAGVTLAAIQGLNQKMQEKDAALAELRQENAELNKRLADLEALVTKLAAAQR
jgi:hypothetical protein